jgi:hypothetical protein
MKASDAWKTAPASCRGGKSEHHWTTVVGNAHRSAQVIRHRAVTGKVPQKIYRLRLSKGEGKGEMVRQERTAAVVKPLAW